LAPERDGAPPLDVTSTREWLIDTLLVLGLATAAYIVGVNYVRSAVGAGLKPEFYQFEFGPAAMLACGRGYVSPVGGESPVLDQFLNGERDAVPCDELPRQPRLKPLDGAQFTWKYLLRSAAVIWRFRGVAWSHLVPLCGMLFAATVALTFLVSRLLAGRVASSIVAVSVMLSPLHWSQLPQLRDYSKAPFMLALIALLALLVRGPAGPARVLALAAGFGVILGLGTGFRSDLLIVAPIFVVAVIAFMPGGLRRNIKLKTAALCAAILGFVVAARPLLGAYAEGGGLQVVALLGFVTPFDEALEVERGPYEFGYAYSDWYMGALIRDFGRREGRAKGPIRLYGAEYNAAGSGMIRELIKTVPADIVSRAYASVASIARLPVSSWTDSHWPPRLPPDSSWQRMFETRSRMLQHGTWIWPTGLVVALVVASLVNLRVAAFAVLLLLFFGGYPALQFHERHFFHLEAVPAVALAFLCSQAWRAVAARGITLEPDRATSAHVVRAAAFAAGLVVLLVTPLLMLRAYQTPRLRETFTRVLAARREPIRLTALHVGENKLMYATGALPAQADALSRPGTVTSEYLIARIGGSRCEALRLPVTLRYDAPFPRGDFSRTMSIRMPLEANADVQLLAPVFYRYRLESDVNDFTDRWSAYQFRGFEIDARDSDCLASAERVVETKDFPLLLSATLAPKWRSAQWYATLGIIENRSDRHAVQVVTVPADLPVSRNLLSCRLRPLTVIGQADALRAVAAGGWQMDGVGGVGGGSGSFTYLLIGRPEASQAGDQFIVEGTMRRGGLSIGVLRDNQWLVQAPVVGAGRFLAVVQIPSDGMATVVIANNLPDGALSNHFEIVRAGWVERRETL
jgi:hypothetical protein